MIHPKVPIIICLKIFAVYVMELVVVNFSLICVRICPNSVMVMLSCISNIITLDLSVYMQCVFVCVCPIVGISQMLILVSLQECQLYLYDKLRYYANVSWFAWRTCISCGVCLELAPSWWKISSDYIPNMFMTLMAARIHASVATITSTEVGTRLPADSFLPILTACLSRISPELMKICFRLYPKYVHDLDGRKNPCQGCHHHIHWSLY